jgi:hypothetical protein
MTNEEFDLLNEELARLARWRGCPKKRLYAVWKLRDQCRDCDRDDAEFYMVSTQLWRAAFSPGEQPTGRLCLNCLERRLGRRLARKEIGDGCGGLFDGRRRRSPQDRPFPDPIALPPKFDPNAKITAEVLTTKPGTRSLSCGTAGASALRALRSRALGPARAITRATGLQRGGMIWKAL